ncbi:hypothetical protein [Geofilum rubicundum]|uniref:Uncharacterized protein n=1 Tax=Geofilum rubicundum JCM 15548 TaxID=1236989 RepID=A0A0E9LW40_9BACT|nr:hypothetical protein [Geofilum rubicundum]GAO29351.1 hypothetical protein JCM15548_11527 [Geofilum rubicundum JCM 15548]
MIRNRKIKQLLVLLSLPFLIWLYHNQMVNWHYHQMDNGAVIKHAHPYSSARIPGQPYQDHQHTSAEFFMLALLFSSTSLLAILIVLGILFSCLNTSLFIPRTSRLIVFGYQWTNQLRGPPVFA